MATYKLIQDIEAEDHILGPLSLRQFIFALIAAFLFYMSFIAYAKHVPLLLAFFLPPAGFCAFFAFPWGGDQPTETWALAKLRFFFKPRRRVWNQSGLKELVTITVPKKIEKVYSDGLSQTEVKSRLQALANTIDSRGWAIKHINAPGYVPADSGSDRLIDIPNVPPPDMASVPADDIMDPEHNPVAQQFQDMIDKSTQDYRERLVEKLRTPMPPEGIQGAAAQTAPAAQQWFINHNPAPVGLPPAMPSPAGAPMQDVVPVTAVPPAAPMPAGGATTPTDTGPATADDTLSARLRQLSERPEEYGNLRTLQPLGGADMSGPAAGPAASGVAAAPPAMTVASDPAILSLSKNNDLNVSTLAREAQRAKKGNGQDEVVVSLH